MSIKACRILQIIAFVLFALALVLCGAVYALRTPLLRLFYHLPEQQSAGNDLPYLSICVSMVYFLISLVCLIVAFRRPSRKATIAVGITAAALFIVFDTVVFRLLSLLFNAYYLRELDSIRFAVNNYLLAITSAVTAFLTVPAKGLLFLSLGGLMGKDLSQPRKQFPDGTETAR